MNAELDAALRLHGADTDDAVAGELVSVGWGTALFDRERQLVWDANYVRAAADRESSTRGSWPEPPSRCSPSAGWPTGWSVVADQRRRKQAAIRASRRSAGCSFNELVMVSSSSTRRAPSTRVDEVTVAELATGVRSEVQLDRATRRPGPAIATALAGSVRQPGRASSRRAARRAALRGARRAGRTSRLVPAVLGRRDRRSRARQHPPRLTEIAAMAGDRLAGRGGGRRASSGDELIFLGGPRRRLAAASSTGDSVSETVGADSTASAARPDAQRRSSVPS